MSKAIAPEKRDTAESMIRQGVANAHIAKEVGLAPATVAKIKKQMRADAPASMAPVVDAEFVDDDDSKGDDVMIDHVMADIAAAELPELASIANQWHVEAGRHHAVMLAAGWHAGQALLAAKAKCDHGEWQPWVEANFDGSYRTAAVYMQLARNVQSSAHLDSPEEKSIAGALRAISSRDQGQKKRKKRRNGASDKEGREQMKEYESALHNVLNTFIDYRQTAERALRSISDRIGRTKNVALLREDAEFIRDVLADYISLTDQIPVPAAPEDDEFGGEWAEEEQS